MQTLNATSPEVVEFLSAWHENGRPSFERMCPSLDYDRNEPKTATERRRWICLDNDNSGVFLADRLTGEVYSIKGYGRPNRCVGTLTGMTREFHLATASYGPRVKTYHSDALGRVTIPE